jgi:hypothetical protein
MRKNSHKFRVEQNKRRFCGVGRMGRPEGCFLATHQLAFDTDFYQKDKRKWINTTNLNFGSYLPLLPVSG